MILDHPKSSETAGTRSTAGLAERVARHLQQEESALFGMLDAVRSLHHSLRFMKIDEMGRSLESEAAALIVAQGIQHSRNQFRAEMGTLFGMPPEKMTLTVLAGKTSGTLRDSIEGSKQKLIEMSTELNLLNRQNAAMLQQSLTLMRAIFGRLTKSAGLGEAYNSGGARENSHVGSLLEWGG